MSAALFGSGGPPLRPKVSRREGSAGWDAEVAYVVHEFSFQDNDSHFPDSMARSDLDFGRSGE